MFRNGKVVLRTLCLLLITVLGFTASVQARSPRDDDPPVPDAWTVVSFEDDLPKYPRNSSSGQTVSITSTKAQQQAALKMWTREARAAAEPMPWPALVPDELAAGKSAGLQGAPGFSAGGVPDPGASLLASQQFPEEWEGVEELLLQDLLAVAAVADEQSSMTAQSFVGREPYGTPAVFDSYMGNKWGPLWLKYPFVTVGKLYITSEGGQGYCSASVISPNNIIVTAAHCVWDSDTGLMSDWTFVPADRKGSAPYGTFPWLSVRFVPEYQTTGGATRYDVALITLGNNAAGYPVTYYTGWMPRSWNLGYTQHHHAIGYPSNIDSRWTQVCASESFQNGTDVLGMGCDMEHGSSGGPWIREFEYFLSGAMNYVNSVVSGGTPGSNTFYGPRFSDDNIVPLCTEAGC